MDIKDTYGSVLFVLSEKAIIGDALRDANLRDAYLRGANLGGAYLGGANLRDANLRDANLIGAYLGGAYLGGANLRDANLRGANLIGAYLRDADLRGANIEGAEFGDFSIVPEEGSFIGWKKLRNGAIAKLGISKNARRVSSLVGRKCRAEYVKVLAIEGADSGYSSRDCSTLYQVGKIVRPDKFDDDISVECTHGIHFFITKREAQEY